MSFEEEFDQAQKDMGSQQGSFFKFKKDGTYKFRIMSEPVKKVSRWGHGICYEGAPYCQKDVLDKEYEEAKAKAKAEGKDPNDVRYPSLSIRWMTWAYLYNDSSFVIFDMPNPIASEIRAFQSSDEYKFTEWPMPFDVSITVKNAGKTTVEYSVLAARQNTEIPADIMEEFAKQTPIQQIKEKLQAKQKDKTEGRVTAGQADPIEYPQDDINAEDIPF